MRMTDIQKQPNSEQRQIGVRLEKGAEQPLIEPQAWSRESNWKRQRSKFSVTCSPKSCCCLPLPQIVHQLRSKCSNTGV